MKPSVFTKAPAFWNNRTPSLAARLLSPIGALYGFFTLRRMGRPGTRADIPVICVGNFTAGGAGKTPTAIALAAALRERGHRPVFLTRGYGRTSMTPVLVDAAIHDAHAVGDEALLLSRIAPTIVSADRLTGAKLATETGATVLIMDDGLQNPSLAKDFTLGVVDGGVGFGNGLCLPAGPLRAPTQPQARFVDAILSIGAGRGLAEAVSLGAHAKRPVFRTNFSVDEALADQLGGTRVLAFAGIGRPEKFYETLAGLYAKIDGVRSFPDHHIFTDADAQELMDAARSRNLVLVTTEKDAVRLKGSATLDSLAAEAKVLPIRLTLADELLGLICEKLKISP